MFLHFGQELIRACQSSSSKKTQLSGAYVYPVAQNQRPTSHP